MRASKLLLIPALIPLIILGYVVSEDMNSGEGGTAILILNYTNGTYHEFKISSGVSILNATESVVDVEKLYYPSFDTYMLTEINGVGGDTNMYWEWWYQYDNETEMQIGLVSAEAHIIDPDERIEWRYSEY